MNAQASLAGSVLRHRQMIWAMAGRDLRSRYYGSVGGFVWALLHPLAMVAVYYFVFAVGFRAQGPQGSPFVTWFVGGLVPWMFFSETLQAITHSVIGNPHLVKKTIFPTETLPLVSVASGLLPHAVFLVLLAVMLMGQGLPVRWEWALVLYYLSCLCLLLLGIGWILAALQVFYRDIGHGLSIILNIWFWITPIVWHRDLIPASYWRYLEMNPINYLVEGYRGLMVFPDVRWPGAEATTWFWAITILLLVIGNYTFRRLKPEFPDVM